MLKGLVLRRDICMHSESNGSKRCKSSLVWEIQREHMPTTVGIVYFRWKHKQHLYTNMTYICTKNIL